MLFFFFLAITDVNRNNMLYILIDNELKHSPHIFLWQNKVTFSWVYNLL